MNAANVATLFEQGSGYSASAIQLFIASLCIVAGLLWLGWIVKSAFGAFADERIKLHEGLNLSGRALFVFLLVWFLAAR